MKWMEVTIKFDFFNKEMGADLISNIFFETGLHGVVIVDPDDEPPEGWGDEIKIKSEYNAVIGYAPKNEFFEQRNQSITDKLSRLKAELKIEYNIELQQIDEEDWAESWKEYFWPQKIGKQIVVKPTWREYKQNNGEIVIEIDPGMAFGTGTHPSTSLCVEMLEKYLNPDDSILDVGTGSGILLLAAARLGAKNLSGIDIDEVAVKIAAQNLIINGIEADRFNITTGKISAITKGRFDLIIANILTDVIIEIILDVKRLLKDNGFFICSGIVEENKEIITRKLQSGGFEIVDIIIKEKWAAFAAKSWRPSHK